MDDYTLNKLNLNLVVLYHANAMRLYFMIGQNQSLRRSVRVTCLSFAGIALRSSKIINYGLL